MITFQDIIFLPNFQPLSMTLPQPIFFTLNLQTDINPLVRDVSTNISSNILGSRLTKDMNSKTSLLTSHKITS